MKESNSTILITGGSGFIGSHLIELFNKEKINILNCYHKKKIKNLKNVKNIKIDLNVVNFKLISKYKIKTLIHLAWPNLDDFENKRHVSHTLKYQKKFLETIIRSGCQNIIVSGSSLEYGLKEGKNSEYQKTKPVCSYGIAKDELRKYLQKLQIEYNFKLCWLRIFFIYGLNSNRTTLTNLLVKSDKEKKIILNNKIKRDYLDIHYVAKIILKIFKKNKNFGIINLSSGRNIFLKNLHQ